MNYDQAFENLTNSLDPTTLGKIEQVRATDLASRERLESTLRKGTIAGKHSELLLDAKDHFPIMTPTQAQSSMTRVLQLTDVPVWYNGSMNQLRQEVYAGIIAVHPDIQLNIKVPVEHVVALSDGQTPAETSKQVEDPADVAPTQVPGVKRGKLTGAQVEQALADDENRKAVAGRLLELVDQQLARVQDAKNLAERLLAKGLKAGEFDSLSTYIQESILGELLSRGTAASAAQAEDRRQELLNRLGRKDG